MTHPINQPPGPQPLTPAGLAEVLTNLPSGAKLQIVRKPDGGFSVSQEDTPPTKTSLIEADPALRALRGQPITVSEAAERYGVNRRVILYWKNYGFIAVLDEGVGGRGSRVILDEADVAACVQVYNQRKEAGFGFGNAPLFNEDGTLYEIKHPDLARKRRQRAREAEPA